MIYGITINLYKLNKLPSEVGWQSRNENRYTADGILYRTPDVSVRVLPRQKEVELKSFFIMDGRCALEDHISIFP
jgi:hypothetical protein